MSVGTPTEGQFSAGERVDSACSHGARSRSRSLLSPCSSRRSRACCCCCRGCRTGNVRALAFGGRHSIIGVRRQSHWFRRAAIFRTSGRSRSQTRSSPPPTAFMWSGVRNFEGHPTSVIFMLAGAAIWLLACQIEAFYTAPVARAGLMSAIVVVYSLAERLGALARPRRRVDVALADHRAAARPRRSLSRPNSACRLAAARDDLP